MKKALFLLLIMFLVSSGFSHNGEDHGNGPQAKSTSEILLPFQYFADGDYLEGIFVFLIWVLLLKGIYELIMLILARATINQK